MLHYFEGLGIPDSPAKISMKAKAQDIGSAEDISDIEWSKWDEELSFKVFFSDEVSPNERDREIYKKLSHLKVSKDFPNLLRWSLFMKKKLAEIWRFA